MGNNDDHIIRFAQGREFNFGKAKNRALQWNQFKDLFRNPARTNETMREYGKLPVERQTQLKAIDGWVFRTQIEGKSRNAKSGKPSDLLSLDFDYATPEFVEKLLAGLVLLGVEFMAHSSRRHTAEKPRLRIYIPLARPIDNDAYGALSRIVARMIDPILDMVDPVSFRKAQMMFLPTLCKDSEYVLYEQDGELLEWEEVLEDFTIVEGDWRDVTNLPRATTEDELRETSEKAEDPTEKTGPVGDFCRAYDVIEAIDRFDLPYSSVDMDTGKPRFTYTGGTTVNGAEVQDDGLFLYSHHGSDPASDQLLNAFDLVRVHKFGHLDDPNDKETPMGKRKSWIKMIELIQKDDRYRKEALASRYDQAAMQEDLDEAADALGYEAEVGQAPKKRDAPKTPAQAREDEEEGTAEDFLSDLPDEPAEIVHTAPASSKKRKPASDWMQQLQLTKDGDIMTTPANVALIIANDNRLCGAIAFNEFTQQTVLRHEFLTKSPILGMFRVEDPVSGDLWSDAMTDAIRIMLSIENGAGKRGWGIKATTQDVRAAVDAAARVNPFHPVRDFLETLKHDGQTRVDRLWIDYAGSPDNDYYHQAARMFMVACVARIYEPGHKFDFVPILFGAQGKRKSTFINALACEWFGELKAKFSEEAKLVEQMQGCWLMEIPELSGITKSVVEDVKAFISATKTQVRLAYGHHSQVFKRQCCFIGSTNEDRFLVDHTGNRRWWPIAVGVDTMDTVELERNRNQLWAEAVAIYKAMRAEQPHGTLPLYLTTQEAQDVANEMQDNAEMNDDVDALVYEIGKWLGTPTTDHDEDFPTEETASGEPIWRDAVAVSEVWSEVFEQIKPPNNMESRNVRKALNKLGWHSTRGDVRKVREEDGRRTSYRMFRPSEAADLDRREAWAADSEPQRELESDDIENMV